MITPAAGTSKIIPIHSNGQARVHRAGWVVSDPRHVIENGSVTEAAGAITDVGTFSNSGGLEVIDHGPGILMPALVNAHVHLELSALKGQVPCTAGFREWVRRLLAERERLGTEALKKGAEKGIAEMLETGTAAAGDISTLNITRELMASSHLAGVWFREMLGEHPSEFIEANSPAAMEDHRSETRISLAGHAPQTTAPDLLVRLKAAARKHNLPFSIHLAESDDEHEFITTARGPWADFLKERGIDFSAWNLPAPSPVTHLNRLGILDRHTLAVHLNHASAADLELLAQKRVRVCVCPRSNQNLHRQLPDLVRMLNTGLAPCLGTDSLASTDSLSLFDEMAFVRECCPGPSSEQILDMATRNGAGALGLDNRYGVLKPGMAATFIYLPIQVSTPAGVVDGIVNFSQWSRK